MTVLLDTSVVARALDEVHREHPIARAAVQRLHDQKRPLVIVPQVAYELFVAATRPLENNGFGLNPADAAALVDLAVAAFPMKPDSPTIFSRWRSLVEKYDVRGKTAHDARLIAAMEVHGIRSIMTFNLGDFRRYSDTFEVLDPNKIIAP